MFASIKDGAVVREKLLEHLGHLARLYQRNISLAQAAVTAFPKEADRSMPERWNDKLNEVNAMIAALETGGGIA